MAIEVQKNILLSTMDAAKTYKETKAAFLDKKSTDYFCAIDTYEKLSKHLNIDQIYIDRKAYLVESKGTSISEVVNRVQGVLENLRRNDSLKNNIQSALKENFKDILDFLDTKKDRDVFEAITAKISSVKSVVSLKGTQFKGSIRGHVSELNSNLDKFKEMRSNLQTRAVRTDRTVSQQYTDIRRATTKMKTKMFKSIADGRGRKLKCEEFPELAQYIEFAFGEGDRVLRGGGGLQADPRLLDTTLFKAADNATVMRHAKEMIAKVRPDFKISTSCLYTYTMNYKKGSKQAERHHHGKGVNANISLHKAPNTSQHIYPVNAHWSTSHVNYLIDSASENANDCFLDSKDAKCIVCGDIAPVLKPGKSWSTFETPDHSFDQSRVNAVTPMTHLFMDIPKLANIDLQVPGTECVVNVTRSGKVVTLINLSLTEPETVFRVFNELFYLMTIPSLDKYFRNPETGNLKEIMGFIVDNGPSEAPSSFLVQMLLVRLLKFLNLDKVTQRAFAEYLSKRNFVERVHATENSALSSHGPFSSKGIHTTVSPGSKEHKENMECMAGEVIKCIGKAVYNKENIQCFRGIGSEERFLFNDESNLKSFSLLSDKRKRQDETTYQPTNNAILNYLEKVWHVKTNFTGRYSEDYCTLTSTTTASIDKYSTSIFRDNEEWRAGTPLERFDRQPLPDYRRWEDSGELHYLSYEARRDFPPGPWDECPGLFLPEKVLETCFRAIPVPLEEDLKAIAFLAWVSMEEASQFFENAQKQLRQHKEEDLKREAWKLHPLYKESRATLVGKLTEGCLNPTGKKYELVQQIVESRVEDEQFVGMLAETDLYDGNTSSIPNTTAGLMKLSVAHLRAILRAHDVLEVGSKEELIARVGLLKAGHQEAAFSRERLCILHYITVAKEVSRNQAEHSRHSDVIRTRAYAHGKTETMTTRNSCLQGLLKNSAPTIDGSCSKRDLQSTVAMLENKLVEQEEKARSKITKENEIKPGKRKEKIKISKEGQKQINENVRRSERKRKQPEKLRDCGDTPNFLTHVGTVVDVLWTQKDLDGTNRAPGWYRGEVQRYDENEDTIFIFYFKDCAVYSLNVTGAFADGIIRPVKNQ